jgi:hypothetical protein
MNIDKIINRVAKRYEKILSSYYPSFESVGFTERNLTFNFCSIFYNMANDENLIIWQEVPIKSNDASKKEHFDSLIISRKEKAIYVIEAKRLGYKRKVDAIKTDFDRIKNRWKYINIDENTKTYSKYAVVIADIWIPHSNEQKKKTKEDLLIEFKDKFKKSVQCEVLKNNGPLTENERYFILGYIEEIVD